MRTSWLRLSATVWLGIAALVAACTLGPVTSVGPGDSPLAPGELGHASLPVRVSMTVTIPLAVSAYQLTANEWLMVSCPVTMTPALVDSGLAASGGNQLTVDCVE